MSDRPGMDLSTVQIVASMAAAVTGAIVTSYLGNGGTIVGTAVGAGATTTGFAVYKHYLARTKEKVAPVIVDHARHWTPGTGTQPSGSTEPGPRGAHDAAARTVTSPNPAANGATVSGANGGRDAASPSGDQTQPLHAGEPGDARTRDFGQRDFGQAETQTAQPFGTVRMGSAGDERDGGPGRPGPVAGDAAGNGRDDGGPGKRGQASGGGIGRRLRDRPRWVVMAATSAAVFLVAILVITLIEFGTGKPIDASVWGRKASGTTLGNVTGGHSNSNRGTVTPTVSPTPTQSATPGGVGQTAPQPKSSASTAPSPSSVPSVSTAPSQSAPVRSAPAQNGSAQTPAP